MSDEYLRENNDTRNNCWHCEYGVSKCRMLLISTIIDTMRTRSIMLSKVPLMEGEVAS